MQIRNTSTNSIITMMDIISIIISRSFTLLHSNNISIKLMHRMIDKVSVVVAVSALLFNAIFVDTFNVPHIVRVLL